MTFLPNDYTLPVSGGNYTKLDQGETKLRILSDAITGYEYWNTENKPVRSDQYPGDTPDIREDSKPKHFWAMVVYNYSTKTVQIWQVSQKSIQNSLLNLVQDSDWGSPKDYDIKIKREGEGLDTRYQLSPSPKSKVSEDITRAYEAKPVDLKKLFTGEDPFMNNDSQGEVDDADNPFADQPF